MCKGKVLSAEAVPAFDKESYIAIEAEIANYSD